MRRLTRSVQQAGLRATSPAAGKRGIMFPSALQPGGRRQGQQAGPRTRPRLLEGEELVGEELAYNVGSDAADDACMWVDERMYEWHRTRGLAEHAGSGLGLHAWQEPDTAACTQGGPAWPAGGPASLPARTVGNVGGEGPAACQDGVGQAANVSCMKWSRSLGSHRCPLSLACTARQLLAGLVARAPLWPCQHTVAARPHTLLT